jgi:flavin reductase (DIM6/NTAB) family NADH-FMN oxidoreductase RutF
MQPSGVEQSGPPETGATTPTGVDEGTFRRAVGRFASGICVVTTVADGVDYAMTVSAFASVSLEPLQVLVCVELEARFHDAVLRSGFWGVSVLDGTARPVADWLATRGRPLHGQLDRIPHHRGPVTGTALLGQAVATLEVRTAAVYPGGDHSIVLGDVLAAEVREPASDTLLYHRGSYRRLD